MPLKISKYRAKKKKEDATYFEKYFFFQEAAKKPSVLLTSKKWRNKREEFISLPRVIRRIAKTNVEFILKNYKYTKFFNS